MKTILISPPTYFPIYNQAGKLKNDDPSMPLGILSLAAMLEKDNIDVKAFDMFDMPLREIADIIIQEKPDIVGISCFTETRFAVLTVAKLIKTINQDIKIVLGGSHATFFAEQILKNYKEIDYIILGEGEYSFLELVKNIESKKSIENITGLAYRNGEKIIINNPVFIKELDLLPFPAYHHISFDKYFPSGVDIVKWTKEKINNLWEIYETYPEFVSTKFFAR